MSARVVLYDDKKSCYGCSACMNICPTNSISMKADGEGFIYPEIDSDSCIECGLCRRVCERHCSTIPEGLQSAWAAAAKQESILNKSASGGAFTVFAECILKKQGVVYGCALCRDQGILNPQHIRVDKLAELERLQGSKYVQSDIAFSFRRAKEDLEAGKYVLFSGTPCQIGGLKAYLGKEYNSLYTVDIVCHGVPNKAFFQEYLKILEKRLDGKILDYSFRDKTFGWGLRGLITWETKNGKIRHRLVPVNTSSYYKMFLDAEIYRDSCYGCRYAQGKRPGDITVGDYWGIEIEHPEVLEVNPESLSCSRGISCVLANTAKGNDLVQECAASLTLLKSLPEKVIRHNAQLQNPSPVGEHRGTILQLYREGGYKAVHKWCNKRMGLRRIKSELICHMPLSVQAVLRKVMER